MKRPTPWYLWILTALAVNGTLASAQEADPRLKQVFADWQKRQDRIKSVRYVVRGEHVIRKGHFSDLFGGGGPVNPPRDIACTIKRVMLLDFATNRHRLEIDDQGYDPRTGQFYPEVKTGAFDGAFARQRNSRQENGSSVQPPPSYPDIGIASGNLKYAAFEPRHWPFFVGHGIIVTIGASIIPGKLKVNPDLELFHVQGKGVHGSRPCLVIRTYPVGGNEAYDEFWVDTARESAVVRQIQSSRGKPATEFDIQYRETSHGWLPDRWTFATQDIVSSKTTFLERVRVEKLTIEAPVEDADFRFEEKPGMLITETQYGEQSTPDRAGGQLTEDKKFYRVADDGERHEVIFADGVERRRWPVLVWWVAGAVSVLGLAAGWWLIRHRHQKQHVAGK